MKKYEGRLAGILGTIIIHLIGAIVFMSVKLSSLYNEKQAEFLVEFQSEQRFIEDDIVEVPKTLEELFREDDRFRDIIRNIANTPDVVIDEDEYVDRVKEELIASGLLGEDNFIDEQKSSLEKIDEGDTALDSGEEETKEDKITTGEMASQYEGPTRIFYDLAGRYHLKLPIPIYKCEGSGILVIRIIVNQRGNIIDSKIDEASSSTFDPCLTETALNALSRTRFNPDDKAAERQIGTITFHFVAQ